MTKTREAHSFVPPINSYVTIGWIFLLLSISEIISSNLIKHFTSFIWIEFVHIFININHIVRILINSFIIIKNTLNLHVHMFWLTIDTMICMYFNLRKRFYQQYHYLFLNDILDWVIYMSSLIQSLQLLLLCMDDQ